MIAVGASIFAGISTLGDAADELPPGAILTLNALNSDMFFTVAVGTAVFNLALALAVLRHGGPSATARVGGARVRHPRLDAARVLRLPGHGIVIVWASVALAMRANTAAGSPPVANP